MTKRNQNQFVLPMFALAVMLTAGACYGVKPANQPPTAVITVSANGAPVVANSPIPFMGDPVTITLDGSNSKDVDGTVVSWTWRRTDVSAAMRFGLKPAGGTGGMMAAGSGGMMAAGSGGMMAAGSGGMGSGGMGGDEDGGVEGTGGMMAMMPMMPMMPMTPAMPMAPPPPAFMGDPPAGQTAQVTLTEKGKYRYSLWVKDNDGAISLAANFVVKLGGFAPEMTCSTAYMMQTNMDCRDCSCTPKTMGGCQDEVKACLQNADPEFKMLCSGIVNCAIAKKCSGSACYTGGCMAEITAAAMYMGGSLPASCDPGMAATNPCGASAALSACQMKAPCSDVCK